MIEKWHSGEQGDAEDVKVEMMGASRWGGEDDSLLKRRRQQCFPRRKPVGNVDL
jgi:hypothetical protein